MLNKIQAISPEVFVIPTSRVIIHWNVQLSKTLVSKVELYNSEKFWSKHLLILPISCLKPLSDDLETSRGKFTFLLISERKWQP